MKTRRKARKISHESTWFKISSRNHANLRLHFLFDLALARRGESILRVNRLSGPKRQSLLAHSEITRYEEWPTTVQESSDRSPFPDTLAADSG